MEGSKRSVCLHERRINFKITFFFNLEHFTTGSFKVTSQNDSLNRATLEFAIVNYCSLKAAEFTRQEFQTSGRRGSIFGAVSKLARRNSKTANKVIESTWKKASERCKRFNKREKNTVPLLPQDNLKRKAAFYKKYLSYRNLIC